MRVLIDNLKLREEEVQVISVLQDEHVMEQEYLDEAQLGVCVKRPRGRPKK